MEAEQLFYNLLKAEDETKVDTILSDQGYLGDDSMWLPLGGIENNFSTVGNQQADPTGALVDKLINGIDAVLMSECFSTGVSPESAEAPQSMKEAVERFFGVRDGRLDGIDARERTSLAEKSELRLVAVGSKESPCYLLIDKGEGQTPAMFPDTFLSLHRSNKLRIPFVQGKFNAGGTGVLQFCGARNYQLIVSKRHPMAPRGEQDSTADLWGFTLVRRLRPTKGERSSMYVYLAPNGRVLAFGAESIRVLPGDEASNRTPTPYSRPLEYGTCVKLYNYRWRPKSTATTEARYEIERYLQAPCLPFRVTETRDYRANYYSTTIAGVWATVNPGGDEKGMIEQGFPAAGELNIEGIGSLPYRIAVFGEQVNPRHVPHGVFFTLNGQRHGSLPNDFTRGRLKFDYLSRHLLVSVDCTQMEESTREDFFMASRDRIRENEAFGKVVSQLEEELRSHPGLKALNAAWRKREIEKALDSERGSVEAFQHLLRSDPSLAGLLSSGIQLVTSTGPGDPPEFKGRKFPTFFRLSKGPKKGLTKYCPINRSILVEFETDAANDYFERADSPGSICFQPDGVKPQWKLWNGRLRARFTPLSQAEVGDHTQVRVTVSDVENEMRDGPFEAAFQMVVDKPSDREQHEGGSKEHKQKSHGKNGRDPLLAVPNIIEVTKEQWNGMEPPFSSFDSLRVRSDGAGGYDFYLNVDNSFLLTELSRSGRTDKDLMRYWFKYGLVLCGLGMLQQYRTAHSSNGQGDTEADEHEGQTSQDPMVLVNEAMTGLARVIIPVVRRLYRGPN